MKNLLVPEVAARLRRSKWTIQKWVREGKIRPINGTGGRGSPAVFSEVEIQRFENTRRPM